MNFSFVVGVDYSLLSPSICISPSSLNFQDCQVHFYTKEKKYVGDFGNIHGYLQKSWQHNQQRFDNLATWAIDLIPVGSKVFLEDYALHGKGRLFEIAEATGLFKFYMRQANIPFELIPPTTLKKFFFGKGNAKKDQMYESFLEKTNVDLRKLFNYNRAKIESPLSDVVDSTALVYFGVDHLGKKEKSL